MTTRVSATQDTAYDGTFAFIYGTVTGSYPTQVLNVSVGSEIRFWNFIYRTLAGKSLVEVDWSVSGGQLISADPSKTSYSLSSGKYDFVPQNWADTAIISPGPSDAVFNDWAQGASTSTNGWTNFDVEKISFYVDKTVGNQVWTMLLKFSDGTSRTYNWNVVVTSPVASLTFTPPQGGNVFHFGPFLEKQNGTEVDTPVAWNDTNYLNPPIGSSYVFGCMSGTVNAWTFQGSVTNGTPTTGYAYCVQLVRILAPPQVAYAKTGYNVHLYVSAFGGAGQDGYFIKVTSPRDGSGNVLWGLDGGPVALTQFPWAYDTDAFTQVSANSGTLAVPPANSIPDLNGTAQSFYADNPNRKLDATLPPLDVLIEMNVNWQFVTHLVWHPDGGIPISMSQAKWYLDCNEYNATADLTPTVQNSLRTSGNWDLTKTFQTLGDNSSIPSYLQWFYNQWNYRGTVEPAIWTPRPKRANGGVPNLAPMGSGPMGGATTVPRFGNAALLPRGSAANTVGMNSV